MIDFSAFLTADGWVSLLTLSLLEIVLGIDNIIFISLIAGKLELNSQRKKARSIGLLLALVVRISLLFGITWIIGLKEPLFYIGAFGCTGRDLILFAGGVFLIVKTTMEIVEKIKHKESFGPTIKSLTVKSAILQIVFIDIIFSFDSILTAVGLVSNVTLMVFAVIIAMLVMLAFSEKVSGFIFKHPTVKMLALSFLVVIGIALVLESLHCHVEKAYIYSALIFSMGVELLNIKMRSNSHKENH